MGKVNSAAGYHYVAEGHHYLLDPEVMVGLERVKLIGAGIYTMDLQYLGYWDRFNMPLDLIKGLAEWYKRERSEDLVKRRSALKKQKAREWLK